MFARILAGMGEARPYGHQVMLSPEWGETCKTISKICIGKYSDAINGV